MSNQIDFIGIGVPRAGTTWILKCLEDHPQLCVPKRRALGEPLTEEMLEKEDLARYQSFFPHCSENQKKGHIETGLLFSEKAPDLIKKVFPGVKLIICLRNPIERFHSHKLLKKSRNEPFAETEHKEKGLYFRHLVRYLNVFPKEQVLVLIYEDMRKDPAQFIKSIYRFLGVNPEFSPKHLHQRINPTTKSRQRVPVLNRDNVVKTSTYLKRSGFGKIVLKILKVSGISNLINYIVGKNIKGDLDLEVRPADKKPAMPPETRASLQEFYRKDIAEVEKLINRDLSFWK